MRRISPLFGAAAAALAIPGLARVDHHRGSTRYAKGSKPSSGYSFLGDKGEKAAARRLRQAERNRTRQEDPAKASYGEAWQPGDRLSRRFRLVRG